MADITISDKEHLLTSHGIRPTAIRLLVIGALLRHQGTFTLADAETMLDTVDRSTLFRTLTLFAEHHLLHETHDGSGATKYCLCHNSHTCAVEEMHCHFYCTECKKTICLDEINIPQVELPEGFSPTSAEYVIRGLCPQCSTKT